MRLFRYNNQVDGDNVVIEITEQQIIETYFDHWSKHMIRVGKMDEISLEACIQDFVTVNWAWEVRKEE